MRFSTESLTPFHWILLGSLCILNIGIFSSNGFLVLFLAGMAMFCFTRAFLSTQGANTNTLSGQLPKSVIKRPLRIKQIDTCFLSLKEARLLRVSLARAEGTRIPTLMLTLAHKGGVSENLNPNGGLSLFGPGMLEVAFSSLNATLDDPQICQQLEDWRTSGEARDWHTLESERRVRSQVKTRVEMESRN